MIYLKREDLNHTGAHKINNAIGQVLIARRMGKTRIIAETGAGQHECSYGNGMRTYADALYGLYGKTDVERQLPNVKKWKCWEQQLFLLSQET